MVRRRIHQPNLHAGFVSPFNHPPKKLSSATFEMRTVLRMNDQPLHVTETLFVGLPPEFQAVRNTSACLIGRPETNRQTTTDHLKNAERYQDRNRGQILITRRFRLSRFPMSGKLADRDFCLGINGNS